jgi:hypothetical protein
MIYRIDMLCVAMKFRIVDMSYGTLVI